MTSTHLQKSSPTYSTLPYVTEFPQRQGDGRDFLRGSHQNFKNSLITNTNYSPAPVDLGCYVTGIYIRLFVTLLKISHRKLTGIVNDMFSSIDNRRRFWSFVRSRIQSPHHLYSTTMKLGSPNLMSFLLHLGIFFFRFKPSWLCT